MTDFATAPGAPLSAMTPEQMADGFACGTLNVDRLNWLFQQLFGLVTSYTDCDGVALPLDAQIATCANLAAAIAALPAEKYLQGLQSYNATTNVMTLLMNDGSTVDVDLTGLVNDAVTTALAGITAPDGSETIVVEDTGISVTGTGTIADPYVVGLDMPELVAALCADSDFQDCIASLGGGGGGLTAPIPPLNPFTDTGVTGTPL